MNDLVALTFCGRRFSCDELALIRQAALDYAPLGITEISRTICEWLDWKRPNGRVKNHECRLLLERLQQQGLLTLPVLHRSGRCGPRTVTTDTRSDAQTPIQCRLAELEPLRLTLIEDSTSALWRQFIERYHYLGCRVPVGAHLRYFVHGAQGQILACLLWTSPAWKMAARDRWIGWNADQRARNLQFIVNNSPFSSCPGSRSRAWRPPSWHAPLVSFHTIGTSTMATRRCYWKHSSMSRASTALAIAPPIGWLWEKLPAEEEWIATTKHAQR